MWAKHKTRRQLRETSDRFDNSLETWERTGRPYAHQLEALREQLASKAAELEQGQRAHDAFLAEHPEVSRRLSELDRAIEHEQYLERHRSFELLLQREQARHLGVSHELDSGLGIDL